MTDALSLEFSGFSVTEFGILQVGPYGARLLCIARRQPVPDLRPLQRLRKANGVEYSRTLCFYKFKGSVAIDPETSQAVPDRELHAVVHSLRQPPALS